MIDFRNIFSCIDPISNITPILIISRNPPVADKASANVYTSLTVSLTTSSIMNWTVSGGMESPNGIF